MKKWIFFLVVGLALLTLSTGVSGNDKEVRCDGAIMSPGDVCETRSRTGSVTRTETYDEMKADKEAASKTFHTWGRWALLGGGLALAGLGAWGIVRERRKRKNAGPTTADMYLRAPSRTHSLAYRSRTWPTRRSSRSVRNPRSSNNNDPTRAPRRSARAPATTSPSACADS
jgi:hypothetical protein